MKALAVLFVLLLLVLGFLGTMEAPIALVFGWIPFLQNILPRVTVDWVSVAFAAFYLGLFVAGIHWIGRRIYRRFQPPGISGSNWKLGWSLTAVAAIFLLFTAGLGVIGIVHNIVWLTSSDQPLLVEAPPGSGWGSSPINNLKTIGLAMGNFDSTFRKLPPGGTFTPSGAMLHSWETHLLAFMSYNQWIDMKVPWNAPKNQQHFRALIPEFLNPSFRTVEISDPKGYGLSHYAVNLHIMAANKTMKLQDITDDKSTTILAGEVNAHFKPWGHPVNWRDPAKGINQSPDGFGGPSGANGVQFLMADGSVRFVSNKASPVVLHALSTPCGGEKIEDAELSH